MTPEEFPPNSKKAKEQSPKKEKPEIKQIVSGGEIKKASLSSKFKGVFLGGDFKRAAQYSIADIAIPMLRDMLWAVISKGSERVIYPETARQLKRQTGLFAPRIQYSNPVLRDPREVQAGYSQVISSPTSSKQKREMGELILPTREEAQLLVEAMIEMIDQYDQATVGDLKGWMGLTPTFVDEQWGWTNLASVEIKQRRNGYLVELPQQEFLE